MVTPAPSLTRSLYVVGVPDCPIVKIGIADCPSARVRAFRLVSDLTVLPAAMEIHRADLVVLHQEPGGRRLERALHRRFASRRVAGEWFDLGVVAVPLVRSAAREWKAVHRGVVTLGVSAGQRPACTGKAGAAQVGNSPHLVTLS